MNNKMISIIIPFFNVKKEYFDRCINSVSQQIYKNFEVIIVNDGSKKEYLPQLDEASSKIQNVRVINKTNEGSAIARNVGVLAAEGDYIMFLDADDALTDYCLSQAIDVINDYDVDIVFGLARRTNDAHIDSITSNPSNDIEIISEKTKIDILFSHMLGYHNKMYLYEEGYIGDGPWARIIRKDLAQSSLFSTESFWNDDTIWNIQILTKCSKMAVVKDLWYKYLIYNGSKIRKYRPNCPAEFEYRTRQELELGKDYWPTSMNGIYNRIYSDIYMLGRTYLFHPENPLGFKDKYSIFKKCIHQQAFQEAVSSLDFSYECFYRRVIKRLFCYFYRKGPNIISYGILKLRVCTKVT